jgi:hypothetical protein
MWWIELQRRRVWLCRQLDSDHRILELPCDRGWNHSPPIANAFVAITSGSTEPTIAGIRACYVTWMMSKSSGVTVCFPDIRLVAASTICHIQIRILAYRSLKGVGKWGCTDNTVNEIIDRVLRITVNGSIPCTREKAIIKKRKAKTEERWMENRTGLDRHANIYTVLGHLNAYAESLLHSPSCFRWDSSVLSSNMFETFHRERY